MKRKKLRLPIKLCYEPNRFAEDNLASVYERLCPDKKAVINTTSENSISEPEANQSKSTRRRR